MEKKVKEVRNHRTFQTCIKCTTPHIVVLLDSREIPKATFFDHSQRSLFQ
jgi:hypothetical protein